MDCGNFCISQLLLKTNQEFSGSDFIFSEVFPGIGLLPKIGIFLLKYYPNIEIIHENQDVFVNLKDEEFPLLQEYVHWLKEF